MRIITFGLTVCLSLAAAATAQVPGDDHHTIWVAPDLTLEHASNDWTDAATLAEQEPAWNAVRDRLGDWRVTFDTALGSPAFLYGAPLDTGLRPLQAADATARSRALIADLADALGVAEPGRLRLWHADVVRNAHGHELVAIGFKQMHKGYEVRTLSKAMRVAAYWNLTLGKLSALSSEVASGLDVDVTNPMDRATAIQTAQSHLPDQFAPGTGRVLSVRTFVLVGKIEDRQTARLVHEVRIQTDDPHLWTVVIDAKTGERKFIGDGICHVDLKGNVVLGVLTKAGGVPPSVPFALLPAEDLQVTSSSGNAFTDANGDFTIANAGTTPVTVSGQLFGRYVDVRNSAGARLTWSQPVTPGTPASIVINGTHANEFDTAQSTIYRWTTTTRHMIVNEWTSYNGLPNLRANANLSRTCNAHWDGSSINFYTSGSGCNNTAIPDVIAHEYGHGFHQHFNGSTSPGQFSEGIGDHLGLYVRSFADGAVFRNLGEGFRTGGGSVRDYRIGGSANQTQWPASNKQVHQGGQIWAGFTVDLLDALVTKYGFSQGISVSANITLAQYAMRPPDMPDGVRNTMLVDDNDANLLNGTPNFTEIAAAADRHLIPRPADPLIVQITHSGLPNTGDVVNNYVVSARIISTATTIANATMTYAVNGGAPVTVPMTAGANDIYTANIPAQTAVKVVAYSINSSDASSNNARLPQSGSFSFTVGRETIALSDSFETDQGWTPDPGDNATTGRFERADPFQAGTNQPEDDNTPGAGTICYITQNGLRGQTASAHDVDNGKTSIVSPTLDLSSLPAGAAKLDFAYWLVINTQLNDFMRVDVSSNNGASWTQIWNDSTSQSSWRSVSGLTIPGPYTNQMKIRMWCQDNPNNSLTDCCIDDVVIKAFDDNVAALTANTATPAIGTTVNYTIQAQREPGAVYVFAFSLSKGKTPIPGIGTIDLGVPFYGLWSGTLNGSGTGTFGIPIPNAAILKGLPIQTQVVVAGGANVISNLWSLSIQ